jgi:hypothetical protein
MTDKDVPVSGGLAGIVSTSDLAHALEARRLRREPFSDY